MVNIKPHKKVQNALLIGAGIIFLLLIWTLIAAIVKSLLLVIRMKPLSVVSLWRITWLQCCVNSLLRL